MYHKYPDNTDNMDIETSTDRWIQFDHIRDKIIKLNISLLTVCDTWKKYTTKRWKLTLHNYLNNPLVKKKSMPRWKLTLHNNLLNITLVKKMSK